MKGSPPFFQTSIYLLEVAACGAGFKAGEVLPDLISPLLREGP